MYETSLISCILKRMSIRKTNIPIEKVEHFLKSTFNKDIRNITKLIGGELSCPFAFTSEGREYVIRIDSYNYSYKKDAYAWNTFSGEGFPMPEVISLGEFDEKYYFAITEKVAGKMLENFSKEEIMKMMPSIISTLENIHAVDITKTNGYGYWNPDGNAIHATWKENLLAINNGIEEWKKMHTKPYFNQDILERVYEALEALIVYAPEERYLLHGDYGFSNVIADGEKITAVLDWGQAQYGDFVFDIAWLDTWQHEISYEAIFADYYKSKNKLVPHMAERIKCYKLWILYGAIKFAIESNQEHQYHEIMDTLESLQIDIQKR